MLFVYYKYTCLVFNSNLIAGTKSTALAVVQRFRTTVGVDSVSDDEEGEGSESEDGG